MVPACRLVAGADGCAFCQLVAAYGYAVTKKGGSFVVSIMCMTYNNLYDRIHTSVFMPLRCIPQLPLLL